MPMHPLAKRCYAIAPRDVTLTFADGSRHEFAVRSAEFFQDDFQGELERADDPGATYRVVADADDVVVGRRGPDEDGWTTFGTVTDVETVE